MRQVDSYKHKGVQTINNIYTFDVETSLIVPSENPLEQTTREHYRDKVNWRLNNLIRVKDPNFKMVSRLQNDPELIALTTHVPKKILAYYK